VLGSTRGCSDGPLVSVNFNKPSAIALDRNNTLIIADEKNNRLCVVSNGVVNTLCGSGYPGAKDGRGTSATLSRPFEVVVNAENNVIFIDNNNKIRKVSPSGCVTTIMLKDKEGKLTTLSSPTGLAVSKSGLVYVTDCGDHSIKAFTKDGLVLTVAGTGVAGYRDGKATTALFNSPVGLTIDPISGDLYIVDLKNHVIRKLSNGVVTTVAGNGEKGFKLKEKKALNTKFNCLGGITMDSTGNIYISELWNNTIKKISWKNTS